jgi:hypothetical protein
MSDKKLFRTIHPEVKVLDASKGLVEYVASDESLDGHNEIVLSKGWKFTRFRKNAPFLNSHNSWSIDDQLGKVLSADVTDGQLIEQVQWAIDVEENKLAKLGFRMTEAGYLKAVSVGFYATKSAYRGSEHWADVVKEAKLDTETAAQVRRIFQEQEQFELSSVVIGSNPNALAKAFEDGCVSEEELAGVGFGGDDEFEFLTKAAAAIDSPGCDDAFKALICLEMKRCYSARPGTQKTFSGGNVPQADSSATKRAKADENERHAVERKSFLNQLVGLTK